MILWDGVKFFHEPDNEKAHSLIDRGLAQNAGKEDGLSLAYDHQFPLKSQVKPMTYQTREVRAEPVAQVEVEAVKEEIVEHVFSTEVTEDSWEDYKDHYKASTGAIRARKESVVDWMRSEGLI